MYWLAFCPVAINDRNSFKTSKSQFIIDNEMAKLVGIISLIEQTQHSISLTCVNHFKAENVQ